MRKMVLLRWSFGAVGAGSVPGGAVGGARFGVLCLGEFASYSDASASSPGFTVTGSISIGRHGWYLETSAGTSDHE